MPTQVDLYTVPENMTLFIDKSHIRVLDSDFNSIQIQLTKNGRPIRALISPNNVHAPTLVDDMRNTVGEFEGGDRVGFQIINTAFADRKVILGLSGWLSRLMLGERYTP
jgi:hypothetical protein